jgi:lipopolysaccharide/colanic/teichoic acid biosynthesis glycosyltransferase
LREKLKIDDNNVNTKTDTLPLTLSSNLSNNIKKKKYSVNAAFSFLIYLVTFFIFYYIKKRTLILEDNYYQLLGFLVFSLIAGSVISNKFNLTIHHELWQIFRKLCISLILSLGFLSILLLFFQVPNISRGLIISVMFSGLVIEAYYYFMKSDRQNKISIVKRTRPSIKYLFIDGFILTFFCYFEIMRIIKVENLNEKHLIMFAVIYLSWVISAATTHKFQLTRIAENKWHATGLQIKFYLLINSLVVLSIYFLQIQSPDRGYFIEAVAKYSLVSGFLALLLLAKKIQNKTDEATIIFLKAYEMKDPLISSNSNKSDLKYSFISTAITESVVKQKMQFEYLKEYSEVFSILDNMIDLKSFDTRKSVIIKSNEPNDISLSKPDSYQLFVNLHILNDQKHLNNYLLNVKKTLVPGGVFVGALLPNVYRYHNYIKKYSFLIGNTFYFFDFIWKRIFPKLPITRVIYFTFSKKKNRAISLAEGLGRLVYNGYKTLDLAAVNDVVYFAAAKERISPSEKKFFYSPIFKMKRIGKGGKTIYVYKLRTMYPYSEFIQDFVFEHNNLQVGGKFKDDFRVPCWGKLFRKLFIDELPMLINWVKRDLKLVGVRPISNQYLSLYSKEHQERRKNFKPGLVPPFYVDLPQTIKEIELSEKRYLDEYERNPIKTDIKYFFKCCHNIIIRKARSS